MIGTIVSKFQSFRNRLFKLFLYRAGATIDLIDALAATPTTDSVVKLSLSILFARTYSSLTDVLSSLFRTDLKTLPTDEERKEQTLKVTQLLAEECASSALQNDIALFAIDCTADPRIYADKVRDRTMVHAPNHIPGQKPITVGHEYSYPRRGRPQIYGEKLLLQDPSEPDLEEITTMTSRKGRVYQVLLQRWNDVIMQGSKDERTHEHPFDLLRVTVTDDKGKAVYRRPLWVMIAGAKRREVRSKDAQIAYGMRYDIEHYFRFGKQRLGMVGSQTCETRHEENWHWIGLLSYNMLYYARSLAKSTQYPWEKKKIQVLSSIERPSQVQRDYNRIIPEIGTPAPFPKPRGKSPGRQLGHKIGARPDSPVIRKSVEKEGDEPKNQAGKQKRAVFSAVSSRKKRCQSLKYSRMRRVWSKNRPAPMRC